MGNLISKGKRCCGLCLFPLNDDAAFLDKPTVQRQLWPNKPGSKAEVGPLDAVILLEPRTWTLSLKTELDALNISSQRGCAGCSAIWQQIHRRTYEDGTTIDDLCMRKELSLLWIVRQPHRMSKGLSLHFWVVQDGQLTQKSFGVCFDHEYWWFDHPAALPMSKLIREGNTGSPDSLQKISVWLAECTAKHQMCRIVESQLPYRVVKISKDRFGNIETCLVQDLKQIKPYACLSHRWGSSTLLCRTTKDTLPLHLQSIPWVNLPKTFQEAIRVALHLGLEYLWIDSLCIIQDSKEDWLIQAAKMCDIYQGALITIAATNSTDSSDGLFRSLTKIPVDHSDPSRAKLFIRETPVHDDRVEGYGSETSLLTRGWVFQERLLSSRIVHFTRREVVFECVQSSTRCACGYAQSWALKEPHERIRSGAGDETLKEVSRHWKELTKTFCDLNLTFSSDMLPAIAGVARQIGTAHGDRLGRYVAGLWEHTLLSDLPWGVYEWAVQKDRLSECSVPTWSWASKSGRHRWVDYPKKRDDLKIISFVIELAGQDQYGLVTSAELKVLGYLAEGSWSLGAVEPHDTTSRKRVDFHSTTESTQAGPITVDYDFSDPNSSAYIAPGTPLYVMKTGFMDQNHLCLVLRRLERGERRVFERIGVLEEVSAEIVESWYPNDAMAETLTLV